MSKLSTMLQERFLKKEKPKISELANKSIEGQLTSFSGIFKMNPLDDVEKEKIEEILQKYPPQQETDIAQDLKFLIALSSEVKAINNQAAILHGERIKKAQEVLKKYCEGAFTAWLLATYGNRQTPYNFLQYFDFYSNMPKNLHTKIESMPRQAVYTLASRDVPLSKKEEVVKNYQGETKEELLAKIRSLFPLDEKDKRKENVAQLAISSLERLLISFQHGPIPLQPAQKKQLLVLLEKLASFVDAS
jgi:hypothetical protein